HGIDLGWVTIFVVTMMSMPIFGEVLNGDSWKVVPIDTLLFLSAALAIGKVATITGLNDWIVSSILPSTVPDNIFILGLLIAIISIGLHMMLGSVLAVIGVAVPTFVTYMGSSTINPLVPALLVYTAVAFHYILPFHHITMLVGMGEEYGMYDDSYTIKMGIPLTFAVIITILLVQIPWWHIIGLL
ncbi:MAG: SLC13 family permease, partial [Tissierellia bacterium]|nr:SLC13 family permease [Tissierellia bacterium]